MQNACSAILNINLGNYYNTTYVCHSLNKKVNMANDFFLKRSITQVNLCSFFFFFMVKQSYLRQEITSINKTVALSRSYSQIKRCLVVHIK